MWPLQENHTRPPAPAMTELPEASVWERGRNRNSVDDSKNTAMLTGTFATKKQHNILPCQVHSWVNKLSKDIFQATVHNQKWLRSALTLLAAVQFSSPLTTGCLTLLFFSSVRWSRHGCHPKCRSNTRRRFSPFPKYWPRDTFLQEYRTTTILLKFELK